MAFEIKNKTPLLIRRGSDVNMAANNYFGFGEPTTVMRDGSNSADYWECYDVGDTIDLRSLKAYIIEHPDTLRLSIYFSYGDYIRYYGSNTETHCPDYVPRTVVYHIRLQTITQQSSSKSEEREVE